MDDNHGRFDKKLGSNGRIFDTFYQDSWIIATKHTCNFPAWKIDEVWLMLTDHVSTSWTVGRGQKKNPTGQDITIMSLISSLM